jgi:hypothetical protein
MLTSVTGYWLRIIAPTSNFIGEEFVLGPLPPGTNVYASISLNELNTYFNASSTEPKFSATSYIPFWTHYKADGTESDQIESMGFNQNAVAVENCARIWFVLEGIYVAASALVNVFTY